MLPFEPHFYIFVTVILVSQKIRPTIAQITGLLEQEQELIYLVASRLTSDSFISSPRGHVLDV